MKRKDNRLEREKEKMKLSGWKVISEIKKQLPTHSPGFKFIGTSFAYFNKKDFFCEFCMRF